MEKYHTIIIIATFWFTCLVLAFINANTGHIDKALAFAAIAYVAGRRID